MSHITTNQVIQVSNVFELPKAFETHSNSPRINSWQGRDIANAIEFQEHVLTNRLVAGEITALYGEPKVGKTHLAINCAVMAAIGGDFWDESFPEGGVSVVYVAAERHEQAAQRILASCQMLGLEEIPANLLLVAGTSGLRLGDHKAIKELREVVSQFAPGLMVFDTYVRMVDNDEDKAADADRNIEILNGLLRASPNACAGLLVHHSGKDANKKMRGSSALLAAVTTTWKVSKRRNGAICLSMEDANAFAPPPDCFFKVESVDLLPSSSFHEVSQVGVAVSVGAHRDSVSRHWKLFEMMTANPEKAWRVRDFLDVLRFEGAEVSESSITRALEQLTRDMLIKRRRDGKSFVYEPSNLAISS
jgi:hypothetical protein